jgi:hypothetical protein
VKVPNAQSRVYDTAEKENMFADPVATSQGLGFKVGVLDEGYRQFLAALGEAHFAGRRTLEPLSLEKAVKGLLASPPKTGPGAMPH